MRTRRGWIARTAIVAAAMGLLASACSSGRGEASTPGGDETTSTVAPKAEGSFGDLEPICTGGDASGATAQGVTDTSIKIGFGDDAGFISAPGLNHEMSDAMRAFVGWCNDLGGINGRKIDASYYDAKITEVNNVWLDACSKEFYMVGQGFALDSAQEQARRGCGLPSVAGYAVSPPFSNGPLHHEPTPVPADYTITSAGAQLAKLFPEQIAHAAVVHGDFAAMYDTRDKVVPAFESLGYSFDCNQQYALQGEADWKPFAQKLKDCGIEFVYFIGSPYPNFENLLGASSQLGFDPVWYVDSNFYDEKFADWNVNGLADKVYMRQSFTPLLEADVNPATQQYIDIVRAAGGDVATAGEQSASAFLLWATAAKACGSDLTRDCVEAQLATIHSWTGGGLHSAADPGANLPQTCGMLLKVAGTSFERVTPSDPGTFDCDPSYATKVTGDVLARANLDENRISQLP